MRTTYFLLSLVISICFISTTTSAQTANFDETWKEFLENDKISNMSALSRPHKGSDQLDYAKYLLMNTNTCFCQSKIEDAENLMAEVQEIDAELYKSIPGFTRKMSGLETKIQAYHSIDMFWKQFLLTKEVMPAELEAITATKTICEKRTLAKYSYMTAYYHFCQGDVSKSKDIFENRTLRLAEETTLRVEDVEGLASEVAKMKALYQDMSKLDIAWRTYVETGISPGFGIKLPIFTCNPIPNMKELLLNGVLDVCNSGKATLEKIEALQTESGVNIDSELAGKIKELETAITQNETNLSTLNEAWEAFIPDNKVKHMGQYGYEYCTGEPLIRAYIMDGFAYVCEIGEEMLEKIDMLRSAETTPLEEITIIKINELEDLNEEYQDNGVEIERIWNRFVANDDTLLDDYVSADFYCDNIQQVKDWTIRGLSSSCEVSIQYLEQIELFQQRFEFKLVEELECRVQDLRVRRWDCRYQSLLKLARIEAPDAYEVRLEELMVEYKIGVQPEVCPLDE